MSELEQKIRDALRRNRLSSRNLSAFSADVIYYLNQTALFSDVRVKKTGEPSCALSVCCVLAQGQATLSEVSSALLRVWNEAPLGYGRDSYEITGSDGIVRMMFVTESDDGQVVTGCINVLNNQEQSPA